MKYRPCVRCRGNTQPVVLDSAAGDAEPLALSVHGMPVLACEQGHRQFVDPQFPVWLIEHIVEEDAPRLPAGKEKGMLFFKHFYCCDCGADLAAQPDHRETFPVDVQLRDLRAFKVELTLPVYRCTACSKEQLHSLKELRTQAPQALAHAFRAAEIPPA
jgi:hypothetical protein